MVVCIESQSPTQRFPGTPDGTTTVVARRPPKRLASHGAQVIALARRVVRLRDGGIVAEQRQEAA